MKIKIPLEPGERSALILSFFYFLLLLSSYYVLRPVRDAQVAGLGRGELRYLVIAVLVVMLAVTPIYATLMRKYSRRVLLPSIYIFFTCNLGLFALAFSVQGFGDWTARVFYIWLTVFSYFVVSVFWSFMADVWREEQGRRLFGFIAAGGSVGGLIGPQLARAFVGTLGIPGLTFLSAILLSGTILCIVALGRLVTEKTAETQTKIEGSMFQGVMLVLRSPFLISIAVIIVFTGMVAQFAYTEMIDLAGKAMPDAAVRTKFFANLDFWTNALTLLMQAIIVGLLTTRLGVIAPLLGLAVIGFLSFVALALSPTLAMLGATTVARRVAEYGMGKPGRDMLYTVASPQEKYLAKNVIDTLVYRGCDPIANWVYTGLLALGFTLGGISWISAFAMGGVALASIAAVRGYRARGGK